MDDTKTRILLIEDSEMDSELLEQVFGAFGFEYEMTRVETQERFVAQLTDFEPDIVLADYSLPRFDGASALLLTREIAPNMPFIFVCGAMEEERAIDAFRRGATDYVPKDRINLVVPAIRRALAERDQRLRLLRMEEELRRAQKLEAVGQLAGGVAHDFNNLLTVMSGYAKICLKSDALDETLRAKVTQIEDAARKATEITAQLLAFSRRQHLTLRATDLSGLVAGMLDLLRDLLGQYSKLECRLEPELWSANVDHSEIRRVLMNFATNARDAMPKGGTFTIETTNVHLTSTSSRFPALAPGQYVRLGLRDTGVGMDAEALERIFEPFYTTKDPGAGLGLGLATVYGIITQCDGALAVASEPNQGTLFEILLPRVDLMATAADTQPCDEPVGGTETILVVEDEDSVRDLVRETLTSHGYTVLAAAGLPQVQLLLQHVRGSVELLLTDVALTKGSGPEVAAMVRARFPQTRVLFMSGYAERSNACFAFPGWRDSLIDKPFAPEDLIRRVRTTLDEPDKFARADAAVAASV